MPSNEISEFIIRGGDYEHTLGIPGVYAGVRLGYEGLRLQGLFAEMLERRHYEVCEFSLANYLTLRATGQNWLTAVPVFPYRAFRHSLAVVRRESELVSLAQLAGKRVGVEDYSMTAAVWFRALLGDEHAVDHRTITWISGSRQRFPIPKDARVETTAQSLEQLLRDGAIDAMLAVSPKEGRGLRTLLRDSQADEEAYFERTSLYPIHHCVVIRNDALERQPALAEAVYAAYAAAKDRAYRRRLGTTLVPWAKAHWSGTFERFGGDPLPYGLTPANRMVIERLAGYLQEQGFIAAEPAIGHIFAVPSTQA